MCELCPCQSLRRVTGIRLGSAKATVAACIEGLEGELIRKDTHDRPGFGLVNSSTTMIFRGFVFLSYFIFDVGICVRNLI